MSFKTRQGSYLRMKDATCLRIKEDVDNREKTVEEEVTGGVKERETFRTCPFPPWLDVHCQDQPLCLFFSSSQLAYCLSFVLAYLKTCIQNK